LIWTSPWTWRGTLGQKTARRETQQRADHVREDLRSAMQSISNELKTDMVSEPPIAKSLPSAPLQVTRAEQYVGHQDWAFLRGDWAESVGIEAGPWSLRLAGLARPSPRLVITIGSETVQGRAPLLTIVRPHQRFVTAAIVSTGEAQVNRKKLERQSGRTFWWGIG
jgi:hypothetical protein